MHTLHAKDPLEYLDTDLLDADGIPMDNNIGCAVHSMHLSVLELFW